MEKYLWIFWLVLFIVSIIVESGTAEIVSIFFAFGAIVTMFLSFIPGFTWWAQIIAFLVLSGISLICLRPIVRKLVSKENMKTNVDDIIGKKTEIIGRDENGFYEVKIGEFTWQVINENEDEEFEIGERVTVAGIHGNKLSVRKEDE